MKRHVRVFLGWPTELLGKCLVEVSSRDENYAVVCYEDDEAKHGFLVFEHNKIGTICHMWHNYCSGDEIDKAVISA